MASGYDRIAEAFRLLATVEFPPEFRVAMENWTRDATNAHSAFLRAQRAAKALEDSGYKAAAEKQGCCIATVYNRMHRYRKFSKKTENA